jgi:putative ABC transport system substrate-binding protein
MLTLGVAVALSRAARAQQKAMPVIGFLLSRSPSGPYPLAEFRKALSEMGFVEGQNVSFEPRFAENHYERLAALAADLVDRHVTVIVAAGLSSVVAAKSATTTIPIVFWCGADPVAQRLVASLAAPGGNLTGLADLSSSLGAKRLGHELIKGIPL